MPALQLFLRRSLIMLSIVFCYSFVSGQVTPPKNDGNSNAEDKIEKTAEQGDENIDYDELQQQFEEFLKRPLNLNNAGYEALIQSGLMDEILVNNLLNHIALNGRLIAIEELQSIPGFDVQTIERIAPYVVTGSDEADLHLSFKQLMDAGSHQVLMRTGRVLNQQAGYDVVDTSQSYYAGSPWNLYMRYRYSFSKKYSIGITAEKDAGEEFFKGSQPKGFDFYSAHFFVKDVGIFRKIAVGDYQLEYGQGLNVWSGLAFGKSPDITTTVRNARGLMPYTSVNEESFRRGAAVSLGLHDFSLDVWYSNRKVDGNVLAQDSLQSEFIVSSLQTSGLHRTQTEIADKNSLGVQSIGTHLAYTTRKIEIGFTLSHIRFSNALQNTQSLYNQFQFEGDNFLNASVDYRFNIRNFNFFGEAARSNNNAYAFLNGVLFSPDPHIAISLLQRNYQRSYQAIESNALRESNNFNEKGYMIGINIKPTRQVGLSGYYDMFSFPWLKYQVNAPSVGYEYIMQLTYTPGKKLEMYVRLKQSDKEENTNTPVAEDYLVAVKQTVTRFNVSYKISQSVSIRSRIDVVRINREDAEDNNGVALIQDIIYKPVDQPFSINVRFALFDSDDYDSRIYAYENDVYGLFSIPSYYYSGMRYYLNVRYNPMRKLSLYARIAQTVYNHQQTVGSGLDEINGNSKADLHLAVKWEF